MLLILIASSHTATECLLNRLPLYHDFGLMTAVFPALTAGCGDFMSPHAFLHRPILWLEAISRRDHTHVPVAGGPNFAYELLVKKVVPMLKKWRRGDRAS